MPDAPFPIGMMPDIERFFRDTHPTLNPGQDMYPEVFATEYFFPLQRPKELAEMIRLARKAGPPCEACKGIGVEPGTAYPERPGDEYERCHRCGGAGNGPVTVMEIGADKGGSLYHWCQCLPTVKNVIGCEIRGTPYAQEFERAFPHISFWWTGPSLFHDGTPNVVAPRLPIDVLFIDGDKLGMWRDFKAYLPWMRRPGGIVFMHDVQDDHPRRQFEVVKEHGFRTATILDASEGLEAGSRADRGEQPRSNHDGWLMHWRGRSCGVGVVYL